MKLSQFLREKATKASNHLTRVNLIFKKLRFNIRYFLTILINSKIVQFFMERKLISVTHKNLWAKFLDGVNMILQLKMISQRTKVLSRKNIRLTKWVSNSLVKNKIILEILKISWTKPKKSKLSSMSKLRIKFWQRRKLQIIWMTKSKWNSTPLSIESSQRRITTT